MTDTFDTKIRILDSDHIMLTGKVDHPDHISKVVIFDRAYADRAIGVATISPNGHWTFSDPVRFNAIQELVAIEYDQSGHITDRIDNYMSIFSGYVNDKPGIEEDIATSPWSKGIAVGGFNQHYTYTSYIYEDQKHLQYVQKEDENNNGDFYDIRFVAGGVEFADVLSGVGDYIKKTIANFDLVGNDHDILNMSDTSFHDLSHMLSHTSNSSAGAVIHIDAHHAVMLTNITKAQIAAHSTDFSFG